VQTFVSEVISEIPPARRPRVVNNSTAPRPAVKKETPQKVAKQGVLKASTIKQKAPGKSSQ